MSARAPHRPYAWLALAFVTLGAPLGLGGCAQVAILSALVTMVSILLIQRPPARLRGYHAT